jgi:hypothetical protein
MQIEVFAAPHKLEDGPNEDAPGAEADVCLLKLASPGSIRSAATYVFDRL